MPLKIETKTFRFSMPVALGKVLPVKKWPWKHGKHKMSSPDDRRYPEELDELKEILKQQQESKQEETSLADWLRSKGCTTFIKL